MEDSSRGDRRKFVQTTAGLVGGALLFDWNVVLGAIARGVPGRRLLDYAAEGDQESPNLGEVPELRSRRGPAVVRSPQLSMKEYPEAMESLTENPDNVIDPVARIDNQSDEPLLIYILISRNGRLFPAAPSADEALRIVREELVVYRAEVEPGRSALTSETGRVMNQHEALKLLRSSPVYFYMLAIPRSGAVLAIVDAQQVMDIAKSIW